MYIYQFFIVQQFVALYAVFLQPLSRMIFFRALKTRLRRSHRNTPATSIVADSETELFSAVGADELDEEFFDFSSDENT